MWGLLLRLINGLFVQEAQAPPSSIVMLLRQPHFFQKLELQQAASRAWQRDFASGHPESKHFVTQEGHVTFVKAGLWAIHVIHYSQPFLPADGWTATRMLPLEEQRGAWQGHTAWVAFDCWNRTGDQELEHAVLAALVSELLSGNCAGVYLPRTAAFLPNDHGLYSCLKQLAYKRQIVV